MNRPAIGGIIAALALLLGAAGTAQAAAAEPTATTPDLLAKAKTEEERQKIRASAAEAKAAAQGKTAPKHVGGTKTEPEKKTVVPNFKKRDIPDDPTLGL